MTEIRIAALVLRNAMGEVLSVRKRNTQAFMLPGGKIEPGENSRTTVCREIYEELGIIFDPEAFEYLGEFTAPAANEPGMNVRCDVYVSPHPLSLLPQARAEIAETAWCQLSGERRRLAPLSSEVVFPLLRG